MIPDDTSDDDKVKYVLQHSRKILVIGMSRNDLKPSGYVPRYLKTAGYQVIPLNPFTDEIDGIKSLKSLGELKEAVDIVDVFRPSEDIPQITEELLRVPSLFNAVWLQEGIYSDSILKLRQIGKDVFWNRCMMKEHQRLIF
jgi:predicted CoA-binding protein